jgi:uncharacterized protein involved in exopolysaccharide biosynthesis
MVTGADSELPVEGSGEEAEFGLAQAKLIASFFLRAPARHPRLAATTLIVTVALGVAAALFWPRSYDCDVRILAQHQLVLPALDNPGRAVPRDADAPTKNAADSILQHDNLVAMIKELDLIERYKATRQPILRLKDSIMSVGAAPRTEAEQMRDMIELLQKRLSVTTDESSITIAIQWAEKQIGFEIVSFMQKNFLEARYDSNVNVIVEAIHILEERAKPQATEVDAALADLTKVENERRQSFVGGGSPIATTRLRGGRAPRAVAGAAGPSSSQPTGGADADLARQLEDVRSRIRSITQERDRELMQAQSQLADARATLGPMHPTVVALNQKIAQLEAPPSELHALEEREHQLVAALAAPAVSTPAPAASTAAPPLPFLPAPVVATPAPTSSTGPTIAELLRDDPEVEVARTRLQAASAKYNDLLGRIEAANIELEVTRAAFKYQYTVVRPPEIARKPSKPNVPLVLIATLLAAPLLGMLAAGLRDLLRGRFVEPWQIERHLNLPLLGELNPPP